MITPKNEKATGQGGFITAANSFDRHFSPSYPGRGTQQSRLLAVLLQGNKVDPLRAWRGLGIYRLSDTVFNLRGLGWPVETGYLNVSNRFDEPCRVASYSLKAEAIEAAGHDGEEFAWRELEAMASRRAA